MKREAETALKKIEKLLLGYNREDGRLGIW